MHRHHNIPKKRKDRIRGSLGGRCAYCGRMAGPLEVDHVVPRAVGGRNRKANLLPCCFDCNRAKGKSSLKAFRRELEWMSGEVRAGREPVFEDHDKGRWMSRVRPYYMRWDGRFWFEKAKESTMGERRFVAEVSRLLDLVVHSLYSRKEVFLRELVSNASDATQKARFSGMSGEPDGGWRIRLAADPVARTLTVSDDGIGMDGDELAGCLGSIASSGTREFLKGIESGTAVPDLIGQFGVGFYSAFMVASRVDVVSRKAGSPAFRWTSLGDGTYDILEEPEFRDRGTDVVLYLREDCLEFLDEWRIRREVERFSGYIEFPITMRVRREERPKDANGNPVEGADPVVRYEDIVLNSSKAIWLRSPGEVSDEEYTGFCREFCHDRGEPLLKMHWSVEGKATFSALLFVPSAPQFDMYVSGARDRGVSLYCHRVFVTDRCEELVPPHMRFLKGVVDCEDLPLNVSRETLQDSPIAGLIQSNIAGKVIRSLKELREKDGEKYAAFWKAYGTMVKEGAVSDEKNRSGLVDLLMYEGSGGFSSLSEYVSRMKPGQEGIYYIFSDSPEHAAASPTLEAFRKNGVEVLYCTDPMDEWVMSDIREYKGVKFLPVDKGEINLDGSDMAPDRERMAGLVEVFKKTLGGRAGDVRISGRLVESPCCLVRDPMDIGDNMKRMAKATRQEVPEFKRILELNAGHPLILELVKLPPEKQAPYAMPVYGEAQMLAGVPLDDPAGFSRFLNSLFQMGVVGSSIMDVVEEDGDIADGGAVDGGNGPAQEVEVLDDGPAQEAEAPSGDQGSLPGAGSTGNSSSGTVDDYIRSL